MDTLGGKGLRGLLCTYERVCAHGRNFGLGFQLPSQIIKGLCIVLLLANSSSTTLGIKAKYLG